MKRAELRVTAHKLRQRALTLHQISRRLDLTTRQVRTLLAEYKAMVTRGEWAGLLLDTDAIERLELPSRIYRALKRREVDSIKMVAQRLENGPSLTEIRGIGVSALQEIRDAVEKYAAERENQ
jgi:DNA-directed RNA polymerase alpha subunit